jgi:hypothetical protein
MANIVWIGRTAGKIYYTSGEFSSTLKDSQSILGYSTAQTGVSWDGTNTPWCESSSDKYFLMSGLITSTLKTSQASPHAGAGAPSAISFDGTNTPTADEALDKLVLISGQFTSTIKTSIGSATTAQGVSYDGKDTPWCQIFKLMWNSGQFSSTVKSSWDAGALDTRGMSWNGTNTPWAWNGGDKLMMQSGKHTSTLKQSLSVGGVDTQPYDIDTDDYTARVPSSTFVAVGEVSLALTAHAPTVLTNTGLADELALSLTLYAPVIVVDSPSSDAIPSAELSLILHAPEIVTTDDVKTIVANSRNFAISEYSNFAFNSMGRLNGKSLYANASGIYEGGGDDDDGTKIDASYKTGAIDIYTTEKQLLRDAYLNYRSDGDIQLFSVGNEVNARAYTITNSTNGTLHERRAKQERGIKDRHFSFGVSNINGSSLEIDTVRILTEPVRKRR